MKKILSIGMALFVVFAMISCENDPSPSDGPVVVGPNEVPEGQPVTITYHANGWEGDGVPAEPRQTTSGATITNENLPTLTNTATQIFYGWSLTPGQEGERVNSSYRVRSNIDLYVLFRAPIILSFNYNFDGAPEPPASVTVGYDSAIGNNALPKVADSENPIEGQANVREKWLFTGWTVEQEAGGRNVVASTRFTANTTLYAQWKPEPNWAFMEIDLTMQAEIDSSIPAAPWYVTGPVVPVAETKFYDDGSFEWTFTRAQQRGILLFSPAQRAVLQKIDEFRIIIDGEVTSAGKGGDFRYFVGWIGTSESWNGTGTPAVAAWGKDLMNGNMTFNDSKNTDKSVDNVPQDTRTASWILQHRSEGTTTLKIKSFKIRYDADIGGEPPSKDTAIKISFNRNYDGAPKGPNPLVLDKNGKLSDIKFPSPDPLPVIERNGFLFEGWYTAAEGGTKVEGETDTTAYSQNTTLYAKWKLEPKAKPTINKQPPRVFIKLNDPMPQLTVDAESPNEGELSYQWYKATNGSDFEGTEIAGATSASYTPTESTGTVGSFYYYVNIVNTTTEDSDDLNSAMAQVRVYDPSNLNNFELVDSILGGWNQTENALVFDKLPGEYQTFATLPIPSIVDLSKYASLQVTYKGYLADGSEALQSSGTTSNDIVADIYKGGLSLGNFGYNVTSIDGDTLTFALTEDMQAADLSEGNGSVRLIVKRATNTTSIITKYVIQSVKFTTP
jgi:uncharacterized repeat protein (TIGR02543 family)